MIVAEKYANGKATMMELTNAWWASWDVVNIDSWVTLSDAEKDVARDAGWTAASDAKRAAWGAVRGTERYTARDATREEIGNVARAKQANKLRKMFTFK